MKKDKIFIIIYLILLYAMFVLIALFVGKIDNPVGLSERSTFDKIDSIFIFALCNGLGQMVVFLFFVYVAYLMEKLHNKCEN
jgi:hypothetical protein